MFAVSLASLREPAHCFRACAGFIEMRESIPYCALVPLAGGSENCYLRVIMKQCRLSLRRKSGSASSSRRYKLNELDDSVNCLGVVPD